MAILVSKAAANSATDTNTNVYNLGSKESENVIFGVDTASETFQLTGSNKVTILDVSNGDKVVHSGLSSSGVQAKVTGNTVTLSDGTNDKLVLGALAGGESVTVEFSDGKIITIAASSATTPVYTVVQGGKSTTLNGTAAAVTDSIAPVAPSAPVEKTGNTVLTNGVNTTEAAGNILLTTAVGNSNAVAGDTITLYKTVSGVTSAIGTPHVLVEADLTTPYDFTIAGSLLTANATNLITTKITDVAGNIGTASSPLTVVVDTAAPTVGTIAIASATSILNSTLNAGDIVSVNVPFSEVVNVTDIPSPQLALTIGSTVVQASYDSGTGTNSLVFKYTILDGQTDTNGISIAGTSALTLNNGIIQDAAGNAATLTTVAVADNSGYLVDTTAPTAPTSVTVITSGGTVTSNTITETNTNLTASATITAGEGATVAYLKVGSTIIASDTSIASEDTSVTFDLGQSTIDGLQSKIPLGGGVVSVELRDAAGNSVTSSASNPTLAEAPVRLIKNDGTIKLYASQVNSTLNTSKSIEDALTEADNGSVIELAPRTYYAGTGTQTEMSSSNIDSYGSPGNPYIIYNKAITIRGLDDPSTDSTIDTVFSLSGSTGFQIQGKILGMVSFENIKFLDGAYGVYVRGDAASSAVDYNSGASVVLGGLTIRNSEFVNQSSAGLGVMLNNEPSNLGNLIVENVKFDQSAVNTIIGGNLISSSSSSVHEGIMSFGFDGTAILTNVQIVGNASTSNSPYYGIQLQGVDNTTIADGNSSTNPWYHSGPTLGTITLNNVDVTGSFKKNAVAIYNYNNIDGLAGPLVSGQVDNALDLSQATTGWGPVLNVDGLNSSYNASKWGVTLGSKTTQLQGESYSSAGALIQSVTDSIIIGTNGNDTIIGKAGADKMTGGAGTDTIIGGAGSDYIDGGTGADTIIEYVVQGTSTDSVGTASNSGAGTGADTINGFDLSADTLLVVGTNLLSFVHGTDTEIGTATGTANTGVVGDFATNVGLIDFGANATNDYNDATDGAVAINFTSPVGTFNKANFEARIQYNLTAGSAAATLTGGALNDTIAGGAGNDSLSGGAGDDVLTGNAGEDYLISANGSDTLVGGTGADYLYAKNGDANSVTYMFGGAVTAATNGIYTESADTITATVNVITAQSVTSFNNITAASSTFFDNANIYRSKAGTHIMVASDKKDIFVFKTAGTQANPANPAAGADYADYNNASHATNTIYQFQIGTDSIIAIDYTAGSDHIFYGNAKNGGNTADGALVQTQASTSGWTWTLDNGSSTAGILAYTGSVSDTLDDFSIHLIGVKGTITDVNSFFPTGI